MTDEEKRMLDRRAGVEPEKIKQSLKTSLANAKTSQNKTDIAKYTAQLAYVESKIGDEEDW